MRIVEPGAHRRLQASTRRAKLAMNGVDTAEELRRDIFPALVGPNRVRAKGVAVSLFARSMNVFDRPSNGKPFAAEASAGPCVQCAAHLALLGPPMAPLVPPEQAAAAATPRSRSNAA